MLGPLSLLWASGAWLHAWVHRTGLLPGDRLPYGTVCVGNLTAGGAGKTPAVLRLAERFALRGRTPAILTRGYRRRSSEPVVVVEPFGEADPQRVGDEAALLAKRLALAGTEASVSVGADRHAAGTAVYEDGHADLFLLDDGFSHHKLERDLNLVLVDVTQPLVHDACLPLGRRREPLGALSRADAFLLTRTAPEHAYGALTRRLKRYAPQAPVYRSRVAPLRLRPEDRVPYAPLEIDEVRGTQVAAFCGLGNPEAFFTTLREAGLDPISTTVFSDHHRYSLDDWWRIAAAARDSGADLLVTTEKDIMNLAPEVPPEMRTGAPPLYALEIEMQIDDEEALLEWIAQRLEAAGRWR